MTTVARPAATAASAASAASAADRNQPRSAAPAQPVPLPSVHTRVLLTWIAVFSALTAVQLVLGPYVAGFPMLLRTLVITGVVVPAVVYALVPNLLKVRAAVLRRRH
ncbi:hypothetical protein [Streptomyces sp. ITFR-16]|uniref:hypothetical protein n=1 Tax=Streptomyces sp. ITFR-16 TaxID=3075198 RepID=UPI00288A7F8F|nr:hypothetical protein [Streptomyces sp. ITFR-16]WNI24065.1 hypothetical protein RLT58_20055 [Streptomyces sp. ITFR-16]